MVENKDFTVLIVDDDPMVCGSNKALLEMEGYQVCMATNGREAIELVKNGSVDLLLLDYFMPEMTGEDVVKAIREFNKEIIIILQTGYAGEKPPLEMLKFLEIQGYHDKTEGPDKLLLWIAAGVKIRTQLDEIKMMNQEFVDFNQIIRTIKEKQISFFTRERFVFLGLLAGSLAHNMTSPIFCISGMADALSDLVTEYDDAIGEYLITNNDHHEIVNEMRHHLKDLKHYNSYLFEIVTAIKEQAISRDIYQGSSFLVGTMLKRVTYLLKHELMKCQCKLITDIQVDEETEIKGVLIDLVQVVSNLILNAVQSYEGLVSKVELKIIGDDKNLEICIKDYGKGIPADIKDRLLNEAVTTKEDGTGLGVYSSYLIIKDKFKGNLWFESKENFGTTFYITIPVK